MNEPPRSSCPTCGRPWSAEDFYDSSVECRPCKRDRSRRNRLATARKVALAERFVETLVRLADQGQQPLVHCQWGCDERQGIKIKQRGPAGVGSTMLDPSDGHRRSEP